MPLYEYQCDKCGHRFEVIQKFSDRPKKKCPKCGSAIHKMISSPAIHFKGTGWYVTDYGKKHSAGGGDKGSDKGGDTGSEKSGEKGGETAKGADKTAAKGDTAGKGGDGKSDKKPGGDKK